MLNRKKLTLEELKNSVGEEVFCTYNDRVDTLKAVYQEESSPYDWIIEVGTLAYRFKGSVDFYKVY